LRHLFLPAESSDSCAPPSGRSDSNVGAPGSSGICAARATKLMACAERFDLRRTAGIMARSIDATLGSSGSCNGATRIFDSIPGGLVTLGAGPTDRLDNAHDVLSPSRDRRKPLLDAGRSE
jgi:hypothetical protein